MDLTFLAVALNTTPIVIMGTVSRMEELKGKAVGITRFGSNTDISARFAIRKAGLQPEKDVALVQLEDYPGIMGGIAIRSDRRRGTGGSVYRLCQETWLQRDRRHRGPRVGVSLCRNRCQEKLHQR